MINVKGLIAITAVSLVALTAATFYFAEKNIAPMETVDSRPSTLKVTNSDGNTTEQTYNPQNGVGANVVDSPYLDNRPEF